MKKAKAKSAPRAKAPAKKAKATKKNALKAKWTQIKKSVSSAVAKIKLPKL
ncbi:MAG: hypothetical protein KF681_09125 [Bdellovibrionaceae bacterium]|nr:hypothetical protein [Pseudobdellovibrionaceae bacterium]